MHQGISSIQGHLQYELAELNIKRIKIIALHGYTALSI